MERKNEKGTIKINDHIFAKIVGEAISRTGGKAFPASEKGKLLTGIGGSMPGVGELADNLVVCEEQDGSIFLEWYIIMSFGASIHRATKLMLDYAEKELKSMFPGQPGRAVVRIVGVKSRLIAVRDLEVERKWN